MKISRSHYTTFESKCEYKSLIKLRNLHVIYGFVQKEYIVETEFVKDLRIFCFAYV